MMKGTGFARSQRGEEEKEEKEKEPQEAVPEQKRVEEKKEKKEEKKKAPPRVEIELSPKGPPPVAMVSARHRGGMIERAARGFSLGELSASIISFEKAKRWRVQLDLRRRTVLDGNVTKLTSWLQIPKSEKPIPEVIVKAEKPKPPERAEPKEEKPKEEKPVEVVKAKPKRPARREGPEKEKVPKQPKKAAQREPAKKKGKE